MNRRRFGAMLGRATAGTDGIIWMAVKSAAEFGLQRLGEGEVLQKRRNIGQFRRCGFGSQTVGGGPYENCFTLSANSGMGV